MPRQFNEERIIFPINDARITGWPYVKNKQTKTKTEKTTKNPKPSLPHPYKSVYKYHFKTDYIPRHKRVKTVKTSTTKLWENFGDVGFGKDFLNMTQK